MFRIGSALPHRKFAWNDCLRPAASRKVTILLAVSVLLMCACKSPTARPHTSPEIGWRPVASWSGRGNTQTESFYMDSGQWRIRWEASDEKPSSTGNFRAIVHSTVSGRLVEVAVDHPGAGNGVAYMAEEPRQFFLVIESSGVDWKVAVDEGVTAEEETPR